MKERKQRRTQNNHLIREIVERLRDYEPDEVVIICNKYRTRRGQPPLDGEFLKKIMDSD